jgi:hypothetical protein
MGWARIDDDFPNHPKVWRVGAEGVALFLEGLCHASKFLTDGLLARPEVERMRLVKKPLTVAQKLVEVGLWELDGDNFRIHDYHDYNPTSDSVRERRAATKTRVDRHRERVSNGVTERVTSGVTNGVSNRESLPARVDAPIGTGSLSGSSSVNGEESEKGTVLELAPGQLRLAAFQLVAQWNVRVGPMGQLAYVHNPDASIGRVIAAVRTRPSMTEWQAIIDRALASDFLMGRVAGPDGKAFRMDFWWLIENAHKVESGRYDNREKAKDTAAQDAARKHDAEKQRAAALIASVRPAAGGQA